MTITWNTDCNAPGCPGEIVAADGRTILIQTDWDYPGTAQTFGWSLTEVQQEGRKDNPCDHDGTDGTVQCPECRLSPGAFISAAYDWLVENDGVTANDPGYFGDD